MRSLRLLSGVFYTIGLAKDRHLADTLVKARVYKSSKLSSRNAQRKYWCFHISFFAGPHSLSDILAQRSVHRAS